MLKKILSGLLLLSVFTTSSAQQSLLVGTWINSYPRPLHIAKLIFNETDDAFTVEAWGQCQRKPCYWGKATVIPFVQKPHDTLNNAKLYLAQFKSDKEQHTLLIRTYSDSRLSVTSMTQFNDGSQRNNFVSMDSLGWTPPPGVSLSAPEQLTTEPYAASQYADRLSLRWNNVRGARSYTVEIDCQTCCKEGNWCSQQAGRPWRIYPNIRSYRYSLQVPGEGTMRWRVWANDASGNPGKASQWKNLPVSQGS